MTEELIGQLRLSRWTGRNRRRSDHALIEARRDVWVVTRTVIEGCGGAWQKGGYKGQAKVRSCV
jgi:hypothetical protein